MESSTSVETFLTEFKTKMNIWGLIFSTDREKNMQTLADLELTQLACKEILNQLAVDNYSEGPIEDTLHKEVPMWVFGKNDQRNGDIH